MRRASLDRHSSSQAIQTKISKANWFQTHWQWNRDWQVQTRKTRLKWVESIEYCHISTTRTLHRLRFVSSRSGRAAGSGLSIVIDLSPIVASTWSVTTQLRAILLEETLASLSRCPCRKTALFAALRIRIAIRAKSSSISSATSQRACFQRQSLSLWPRSWMWHRRRVRLLWQPVQIRWALTRISQLVSQVVQVGVIWTLLGLL